MKHIISKAEQGWTDLETQCKDDNDNNEVDKYATIEKELNRYNLN